VKPNITAIEKLIDNKFNGNKAEFARVIGVERSQISKIINHGSGGGSLFFGGLLAYCEKEGLDFKNYVVLEISH
jgi:hypothetical protein